MTIKELIEEFSKHSREYHNPWEDNTIGYKDGNGALEDLVAVMEKLDSMDRRMTKMVQSIHAIQVGCDNCGGTHLTKDCDLDKNENQKAQACYWSGDKYGEDWRKPKNEWLPYEEYKKAKEHKFM